MTGRSSLGRQGENLAKKYFNQLGYSILNANYQVGHLEIDLVTELSGQVVFVEIKTRLENQDSLKENPLSRKQLTNLKKAIMAYCWNENIHPEKTRLDLLIILVDSKKQSARLRHYQDILN